VLVIEDCEGKIIEVAHVFPGETDEQAFKDRLEELGETTETCDFTAWDVVWDE